MEASTELERRTNEIKIKKNQRRSFSMKHCPSWFPSDKIRNKQKLYFKISVPTEELARVLISECRVRGKLESLTLCSWVKQSPETDDLNLDGKDEKIFHFFLNFSSGRPSTITTLFNILFKGFKETRILTVSENCKIEALDRKTDKRWESKPEDPLFTVGTIPADFHAALFATKGLDAKTSSSTLTRINENVNRKRATPFTLETLAQDLGAQQKKKVNQSDEVNMYESKDEQTEIIEYTEASEIHAHVINLEEVLLNKEKDGLGISSSMRQVFSELASASGTISFSSNSVKAVFERLEKMDVENNKIKEKLQEELTVLKNENEELKRKNEKAIKEFALMYEEAIPGLKIKIEEELTPNYEEMGRQAKEMQRFNALEVEKIIKDSISPSILKKEEPQTRSLSPQKRQDSKLFFQKNKEDKENMELKIEEKMQEEKEDPAFMVLMESKNSEYYMHIQDW